MTWEVRHHIHKERRAEARALRRRLWSSRLTGTGAALLGSYLLLSAVVGLINPPDGTPAAAAAVVGALGIGLLAVAYGRFKAARSLVTEQPFASSAVVPAQPTSVASVLAAPQPPQPGGPTSAETAAAALPARAPAGPVGDPSRVGAIGKRPASLALAIVAALVGLILTTLAVLETGYVLHLQPGAGTPSLALFSTGLALVEAVAASLSFLAAYWLSTDAVLGRWPPRLGTRYWRVWECVGKWRTAHSKATGLLVVIAITAAVVLMSMTHETAESYCHGIYDNSGRTPQWVASADNYSDYSSCVDWYEQGAVASGP